MKKVIIAIFAILMIFAGPALSSTTATDNPQPAATEITTNMPPICPVMSYAVDNLVSKPVDTAQTPTEKFVAEWKALPFEEKVFIIAVTFVRQYRLMKEPQECEHCDGIN